MSFLTALISATFNWWAWAHHFPLLPLLDWLASEMRQHDSLKHLHSRGAAFVCGAADGRVFVPWAACELVFGASKGLAEGGKEELVELMPSRVIKSRTRLSNSAARRSNSAIRASPSRHHYKTDRRAAAPVFKVFSRERLGNVFSLQEQGEGKFSIRAGYQGKDLPIYVRAWGKGHHLGCKEIG